jgi:hypothetical protein
MTLGRYDWFNEELDCDAPPGYDYEVAKITRDELLKALGPIMPDLGMVLLDVYKASYTATDIVYAADGTAHTESVVVDALMCSTMSLHGDVWIKYNAQLLGVEHYELARSKVQHCCPDQAVWDETTRKYKLEQRSARALPKTQTPGWRLLFLRKVCDHTTLAQPHPAQPHPAQPHPTQLHPAQPHLAPSTAALGTVANTMLRICHRSTISNSLRNTWRTRKWIKVAR